MLLRSSNTSLVTMEPVDDDPSPSSNKTKTKADASSAPWNQIGDLTKLNEKIDGIRSLREYTKTQNAQSNDGGFSKGDDVLFFSKIDGQYIPGIIAEKKRDKLTKNYIYKIRKIHKRDPDVDEELKKKSARSQNEDPRVEIIKLREQRAKKPATISWNVNNNSQQESYFKIISANDYQIELQIALLKLLKLRVKETIKKRKKMKKLNQKSANIGDKMSKSKEKRAKKQRVAQTFGGGRQQMISMSRNSKKDNLSPKRSRSRPNKRTSSKQLSISGSDVSETEEISVEYSLKSFFHITSLHLLLMMTACAQTRGQCHRLER